mmetsp:Transcript_19130/g.48508  ORF Transcript_19130/g.48508 Transcript_19130/m.48508 type:complete len:294 (-) Transcript_19130:1009-1890(-)
MWKRMFMGPPMMDTRRVRGLRLRRSMSLRRPSSAGGPSSGSLSAWPGIDPSPRPSPPSRRARKAWSPSPKRARWIRPRSKMSSISCSSPLLRILRTVLRRGCTGSRGGREAETAEWRGCATGVPCGGRCCCILRQRRPSCIRVQSSSPARKSTSSGALRHLKPRGHWHRTIPTGSRWLAPTPMAAVIFSMPQEFWRCARGWTACGPQRSSTAWATCGAGRSGRGAALSGRGDGLCIAGRPGRWRCTVMRLTCCRGSRSTSLTCTESSCGHFKSAERTCIFRMGLCCTPRRGRT